MSGNDPRNNRNRVNNQPQRNNTQNPYARSSQGGNPQRRPANGRIVRNDGQNSALEEHYEEMVDLRKNGAQRGNPDISTSVNRETYADLSTFESL